MRPDAARRSRTPARSSRRSGRPARPRSIPVPEIAERCAAAGAWLHVDAAYAGLGGDLPGAPPSLRRLGARGLDRRQPAQVARRPDGLLGALDAASGRLPARVQPRPRVPAVARRRREPQRGLDPARPPFPRAQAVGGSALLRPLGAPGADPRARAPRRALRELGARRAGLGGRRSAALLARLLPAGRARTRRTSGCSSGSTTRARCSSRTRASADRYVLRLAIGNFRTTEEDVRLAWDVLRREAASL